MYVIAATAATRQLAANCRRLMDAPMLAMVIRMATGVSCASPANCCKSAGSKPLQQPATNNTPASKIPGTVPRQRRPSSSPADSSSNITTPLCKISNSNSSNVLSPFQQKGRPVQPPSNQPFHSTSKWTDL